MSRPTLSRNERAANIRLIEKLRSDGHALKDACEIARISRSTYYAWKQGLPFEQKPPITRDWQALSQTFKPRLARALTQRQLQCLRRELAGQLRSIFSRPSRPRQTVERDELQALLKHLRDLESAFQAMSDHCRGHLDAIHEPNGTRTTLTSLLERSLRLTQGFDEYVQAFAQSVIDEGEARGGPLRDSNAERLITALAHLYVELTGRQPHHTIGYLPTPPDDDEDTDGTDYRERPVSEFNLFVEDVISHFFEGTHLAQRDFTDAMRHCCARIIWDPTDID